jgi:hypothetical protein
MNTSNESDMEWARAAVRELMKRLAAQARAALRKQR